MIYGKTDQFIEEFEAEEGCSIQEFVFMWGIHNLLENYRAWLEEPSTKEGSPPI
jgi:hypothetical protein